jgi:hypothetical protein
MTTKKKTTTTRSAPVSEIDAATTEFDKHVERVSASLVESAALRKALIARFGFMPMSVLSGIHRGALSQQMFHYAKEIGKSTGKGRRAEKLGGVFHADRALRISGGGSRSKDGHAWSVMPAELVEFWIKYYAKPGQMYLDPFAGQGVQMQVAHLMGLKYIGFDLSREFCDFMWGVQRKLALPPDADSTIHFADSKRPDIIPDEIGDFCFTSPPYWDIEYYGDEPEQLGTNKSYDDFLLGMFDVAKAWLPKFKHGAVAVINVNDFEKNREFYDYSADTSRVWKQAGWKLVDKAIIPFLVGGLPKVFAASSNARQKLPKVHEYCLIFRRP